MKNSKGKRYYGIVQRMEYLETKTETYGDKTIDVNLYSIKFDTEKDVLLTKRDVNAPQELIGKMMGYYKTPGGLIYKSKVIKNI